MRIVRGRADARWLPSRHNFALFRLVAYAQLRRAAQQTADVILIIDRHQSAFENYAVSLWVLLTLTCYAAATLFASWPLPAALAAALPVGAIAAHAPFFMAAPFLAGVPGAKHLRMQSLASMSILTAGSMWLATRSTWVRYAAWQFLALVALNAIAAAVAFFLRDAIARSENAFERSSGGSPSEL